MSCEKRRFIPSVYVPPTTQTGHTAVTSCGGAVPDEKKCQFPSQVSSVVLAVASLSA